MPQLIFYIESGYPQIYNLSTRKATIGRNEDNDVHLNDPRVSVYHAELVRNSPGSYQLIDLDTDNGTAVNGKLIDEHVLEDGDQIKFGSANAAYVDQVESDEDKVLREAVEKDINKQSEKLTNIEAAINDRNTVLAAIPDSKNTLEVLETALADLFRRNELESTNLKAIQSDLEKTEKKHSELQSELRAHENELQELENDRAELQAEFRRVHAANESSGRIKAELNAELDALRKEVEKETTNLDEKKTAHDEAIEVIEKAKALRARMDEFDVGLRSREISFQELGKNIEEREKTAEELAKKIDERNGTLEQLNLTLDSKQDNAEELTTVISQKNDQIKSSTDLLVDMESTLQKEIDEVSRSEETQLSLSKECHSLSHLISGKTAILHRLNEKFNARKNGVETAYSCPPVRVIDPAMRSLVQYFQQGAGIPDQDRVNPVGYHALAACTKGSMHREADTIPEGNEPVVLLLHGDVEKDHILINSITRDLPGRILLVCWRENQLEALATEQSQMQMKALLVGIHGIVSVDDSTAILIDEIKFGLPHLKLPLPSPIEVPEWNITDSGANRPRGIFVSANGFDPNSEIHQGRIDLLNKVVTETGTSVSLYHPNLVPGFVDSVTIPEQQITNIESHVKYSDYLSFIRQHHFATGFGKNLEGGEVIGDTMLARAVYFGGDFNNVIDQLLFPDSCIKGHDNDQARKNASKLLSDHGAFLATVEQAQTLSLELISFESARDRLSEFFIGLTARPASPEAPLPGNASIGNRVVQGELQS